MFCLWDFFFFICCYWFRGWEGDGVGFWGCFGWEGGVGEVVWFRIVCCWVVEEGEEESWGGVGEGLWDVEEFGGGCERISEVVERVVEEGLCFCVWGFEVW